MCVVNTRMRAEDRPPNGSCRLKIDRSGKVCMYLERTSIEISLDPGIHGYPARRAWI
jgi:hypothetical protein